MLPMIAETDGYVDGASMLQSAVHMVSTARVSSTMMTSRMTKDWIFATAPDPPRALSRTTPMMIAVAIACVSAAEGVPPPMITVAA